jgi:adenylate kinase family enzyme
MIILLQGPPCSGKSTIARKLSNDLDFLHISKDDLLETFFDSIEGNKPNWLESASNNLLLKIIDKVTSNNSHIIIESNFNKEATVARLEYSLEGKNIKVIEIFLTASTETLLERFKARADSGGRHPEHSDENKYDDLEKYLSSKPRPISFSKIVIEVNTEKLDVELAYQKVLNNVKEEINLI